jgi:hypothetical protein
MALKKIIYGQAETEVVKPRGFSGCQQMAELSEM